MAWIATRALHAHTTSAEQDQEDQSASPATSSTTPYPQSNITSRYSGIYDGVCHYSYIMTPNTLEIWQHTPFVQTDYNSLGVRTKMLCAGSPVDQVFVEDVYMPWRRYTLMRATIMQLLYYVPAINAFYARPAPRPFHYEEADQLLFLHTYNFVPNDLIEQNVLFNPSSKPISRKDLYDAVAKELQLRESKKSGSQAPSRKRTLDDEGCESTAPSQGQDSSAQARYTLPPFHPGTNYLARPSVETRAEGEGPSGDEAVGGDPPIELSQSATPAFGMSFGGASQ